MRDSGIPPCETAELITIRVPRNQRDTTFINLPWNITIPESTTGTIYTVISRDSDQRVWVVIIDIDVYGGHINLVVCHI